MNTRLPAQYASVRRWVGQTSTFDNMLRQQDRSRVSPADGRSEKVGNQGCGAVDIVGVRLAELRAHPLLFHAQLGPEHDKEKNENDEAAHLRDGDGEAQESSQNASQNGSNPARQRGQ